MKSYNEYIENYHKRLVEEELLDEGFKEFIKGLLDKGKILAKDAANKFKNVSFQLKNKLDKIKDSANMLTIKSLNSVEKVRDFIKKHPQLVWLVLVAIVAGYLVFPSSAHGAVASQDQIKDLSSNMSDFINFAGNPNQASINIDATGKPFYSFFLDIFDVSLKNNTDITKIIEDLYTNFTKALNEFLLNNKMFKQVQIDNPDKALDVYNFIYNKIANNLVKKALTFGG